MFLPNSAEGLHFSAFHIIYISYISHNIIFLNQTKHVPVSGHGDTPPESESSNQCHSPPAKHPQRAMSANFLINAAKERGRKEKKRVDKNKEKIETENVILEI